MVLDRALKSGQIYREFVSKKGNKVILRTSKWEDLDQALVYVNRLFEEGELDPSFGIPLYKKATLETEAKWLADLLFRIELGSLISIVATTKDIVES